MRKPIPHLCILLPRLALSLASPSTLAAADLDADETPLRIVDIRYDADSSMLEVTLRNLGDRPATAWSVSWNAVDEHDAGSRHGEGAERAIAPDLWLRPGDTETLRSTLHLDGQPNIEALEIEVDYVLFDDLTAAGCRTCVEQTFAVRQAQRDARLLALDELNDVASIEDARTRLLELARELEALDTRIKRQIEVEIYDHYLHGLRGEAATLRHYADQLVETHPSLTTVEVRFDSIVGIFEDEADAMTRALPAERVARHEKLATVGPRRRHGLGLGSSFETSAEPTQ